MHNYAHNVMRLASATFATLAFLAMLAAANILNFDLTLIMRTIISLLIVH